MGLRERLDRVAEMPHRNFAGDYRLDARLASEIGRLFFKNEITQAQHDAGISYRAIALAYLETLDGPEPFCDGDLSLIENDHCFQRKVNFLSAREVIRSVGRCCEIAVDRVAIYDDSPRNDLELEALRTGLNALCGR